MSKSLHLLEGYSPSEICDYKCHIHWICLSPEGVVILGNWITYCGDVIICTAKNSAGLMAALITPPGIGAYHLRMCQEALGLTHSVGLE